jgi:hypothetical protein
MFSWDGSEISEFLKEKKIHIEEGRYDENTYWKITNEETGEEGICIVRSTTCTLACLLDEIKPIFGLEKMGTHWIKFKNKKYILIKPEIVKGVIIKELTLNQINYNRKLEKEVQKIFIFRELTGMSKNFESSIILRKKGLVIKPISFYEPNMTPSNCGKVLPNTILEKWFKNTSIDHEVKKMFNVEKLDNINYILFDIREKMEKIFNRLDPESVTNLDEILSRIRSRLQFILEE